MKSKITSFLFVFILFLSLSCARKAPDFSEEAKSHFPINVTAKCIKTGHIIFDNQTRIDMESQEKTETVLFEKYDIKTINLSLNDDFSNLRVMMDIKAKTLHQTEIAIKSTMSLYISIPSKKIYSNELNQETSGWLFKKTMSIPNVDYNSSLVTRVFTLECRTKQTQENEQAEWENF